MLAYGWRGMGDKAATWMSLCNGAGPHGALGGEGRQALARMLCWSSSLKYLVGSV